MQALSKSPQGIYTIKWMFGLPEVLTQMRELHIEEGSVIEVIQKYKDALMIASEGRRFVIGNEIADRIQV